MRRAILDRTKILTSSHMILWGIVGFFYARHLYTFRPERFVGLNSESQNSLELFGGFTHSHSAPDGYKKQLPTEYNDSMETLRSDF